MNLTGSNPLFIAVNGLLIGLIAWVTVGLVDSQTRERQPLPEFSAPTRTSPVTDPLQTILGANLFGTDTRQSTREPAVHAPPTSLNLVLHGVIMAETPDKARAIISPENGQDRSYGLNDTLPGNARISHVYADRVILVRDGVRESLQLSLPIGTQATIPPSPPEAGGRATITGFREQFIRNPAILADYIAAEAVTLKGGQSGWLLSPGANATVFEQLGLKPGDLVIAINDVSATDGMSRIALLNELATAEQLALKVLRKEKLLSFYFTMDN